MYIQYIIKQKSNVFIEKIKKNEVNIGLIGIGPP